MRTGTARLFHALTCAVAVLALVLQLVWQGSAILHETDPPELDGVGVGAIMLLMFLLALAHERTSGKRLVRSG
jgi:hypothetical protein